VFNASRAARCAGVEAVAAAAGRATYMASTNTAQGILPRLMAENDRINQNTGKPLLLAYFCDILQAMHKPKP
jgi:hypothetical protein